MASPTVFDPAASLPAIITAPPTAQFTPGPGCVDPEDHWVVITSCAAYVVDQDPSVYPSPDWLTCQLTQFGPPENAPSSCYMPYTAQTVVNDITSFYSGCPSGYSGASTAIYSRTDKLESDFDVFCCPTQYKFNVNGYFTGDYKSFTTERDGISYGVGYPLPGCTAEYITELSGRDIPVQTDYNTYGWEKRQVENVPWDYVGGTMYAEAQNYRYTVFHGTHTCYQDCYGWYDYYFSGSTQPPFTVPDNPPPPPTPTPTEEPTPTPTPTEEPTPTETPPNDGGSGETQTPPVEESPSSTEETPEPTTQVTSSSSGDDLPPTTQSTESAPTPTLTITPTTTLTVTSTFSESAGDATPSSSSSSPPSRTTSSIPTGAAGAISPTRLILLGLAVPLVALV